MSKGSKLRNNFKVAISTFRANKKTIILTTIGLTIAFSIAFQSLFYLFGSRGALINSYLSGAYNKGLFGGIVSEEERDIAIAPDFETYFFKFEKPSSTTIDSLEETISSIATLTKTSRYYKQARTSCFLDMVLKHKAYFDDDPGFTYTDITMIGLSPEDFDFLSSYILTQNIDQLDNDTVLMVYLDEEISNTIYVPSEPNFEVQYNGNTQNVSLVDTPIELGGIFGTFSQILDRFTRHFGGEVIENADVLMVTTIPGISTMADDMGLVNPKTNYISNIDLDYSSFRLFNVQSDLSKLTNFVSELSLELLGDGSKFNPYVQSAFLYNMPSFMDDFTYIQIIVLTLTLPSLCIAFFMINFSFNLIRGQNIHQINLIKARGATNKQIALSMIVEMLISMLISLILGTAISIPFLLLIARTSGFLEFQSELAIADYGLQFSWQIALMIIGIGVLLGFIINIPRIIKFSRLKVRNVAGEEERKKKPFWRRFYLDFVIAFLALADFIVYIIAMNYFTIDVRNTILRIFGFTTPVFLVVAVGFLIARFFNPVVEWLGNKIWKAKAGTFALSFKNLAHKNKQTSRAVILIVITFSFCLITAIIPFVVDYNLTERWKYVLGADLLIQEGLPLSTAEKNTILDFEEVATMSEARKNEDTYMKIGYGGYSTTILGIDPYTYLSAAHFRERKYKFSNDFSIILEQLKTPNRILLQEDFMEALGINIGDTIYGYTNTFTIIGSFKYFPTLVTTINTANDEFNLKQYILTSRDTLPNIINSFATGESSDYLYFIKQSMPGVGELVESKIEAETSAQYIAVVDTGVEEHKTMPARIAIYAVMNSAFLTTVVCTVAGMIIYSLLILFDRYRELSIIRAIGGLRKEVYLSFIYESGLLLFIGFLIGFPLGIGTSVIVSQIATSYYEVPPLMFRIPGLSLLVMIIIIVLLTIIGAVIPGHLAARKEINDLARAT
jgi:putative ABC transport system permease protein